MCPNLIEYFWVGCVTTTNRHHGLNGVRMLIAFSGFMAMQKLEPGDSDRQPHGRGRWGAADCTLWTRPPIPCLPISSLPFSSHCCLKSCFDKTSLLVTCPDHLLRFFIIKSRPLYSRKFNQNFMTFQYQTSSQSLEPLPEGWVTMAHTSGLHFFFHKKSGVVTWSRPYYVGFATRNFRVRDVTT